MLPAELRDRDTAFRLAKDRKDLWFAKSARLHQNLLVHKARENSTFEPCYSLAGLPSDRSPACPSRAGRHSLRQQPSTQGNRQQGGNRGHHNYCNNLMAQISVLTSWHINLQFPVLPHVITDRNKLDLRRIVFRKRANIKRDSWQAKRSGFSDRVTK